MYPRLKAAFDWCVEHDADMPCDLLDDLHILGVKTEAYYLRVLSKAVRDLYNDKTNSDDFLGTITRLLDEQIVRAWNEGMRLNDLNPTRDMKPEFEDEIRRIQDSEFSYVQGFMDAIEKARTDQTPIDPLLSRAELWAGRYSDVVSRAQVFTAAKDLYFRWVYGDTIEHCETCAAMAAEGIQPSTFWTEKQAAGIYPKSPELACNGFNCDCSMQAEDKPE